MSPDSGRLAETRRREATRAAVRYFALFFVIFLAMGGLTAYTVRQAHTQARGNYELRLAYCQELEKLKTQNREDVARDRHNYARNLRLLGIRDTPALRRAAEEEWSRRLARNAPKSCPYTG